MPSARLFLALGLLTVLLVGGLVSAAIAWATLALDGALLAAFLVDWRQARRTPLVARRVWPPMLVQGEPSAVAVELAHGAERRLTVEMREGLHPALASAPLRRRLLLAATGSGRWSYELTPRRRGRIPVLPLTARVRGPWGLAWSQRELLAEEERRVYPRVRWGGKVGQLLALAQRRQLGAVRTRFRGSGSEPYALRAYLPGDPVTKIHWKATARHDRLVAREESWERGARLVVLLDAARAMTTRHQGRSKLDHALAASLALARVAANRGDRVTVVAFSDRIEREVRAAGGGRHLAATYDALFDLRARFTEPAFDLAAERVSQLERRAATVVLFTSVVDLAAAELLRGTLLTLERRHRPVLVNLEDPELQELATAAPATPADAFAQVSALEILLANRRLGRRLRRAGIRVVNTPADRLALEALEAYLSLFGARGLRADGRRALRRAGQV